MFYSIFIVTTHFFDFRQYTNNGTEMQNAISIREMSSSVVEVPTFYNVTNLQCVPSKM